MNYLQHDEKLYNSSQSEEGKRKGEMFLLSEDLSLDTSRLSCEFY